MLAKGKVNPALTLPGAKFSWPAPPLADADFLLMTCFDDAPEFIDEDNRRFRKWNPISRQQMAAKHKAILPAELVQGKSILDLGACIGATGHWCLANGARYYTGVEVQKDYAEVAQRLLGQYHPGRHAFFTAPLEQWLRAPSEGSFDIVCMLGVLFAFTDYYSVLKLATSLTRNVFAFEGIYPEACKTDSDFVGVQFLGQQPINLASQNASVVGRATRISPKGLGWLMEEFGFKSRERILYPEPITDVPDIYNRPLSDKDAVRYLIRFERIIAREQSLSDDLQTGAGKIIPWNI